MDKTRTGKTAGAALRWSATIAVALALLSAGALPLWETAKAAQFRQVSPIARPAPPPEGFTRAAAISPLPRPLVEQALRDFFAQWNGPTLGDHLSDSFYDKERLIDQIAISAPRDAELRLLSLRGISTLGQFERPDGGSARILVSQVSAIAQTQVEFNSPVAGFVRLEGTHEYNFTITSRVTTP